ncbi:helix-turn-helix transcriptional regulator [Fundidesulfovibrio terrae]|uniref:helix-turn-helix transcriptional regulator n=1 Tax=Fundidesulfovibrio terrae TaxID=2922866 RepID=UPI001FB009DF|nr:hypothetical protein [Fundidesulfovibrio terrae]
MQDTDFEMTKATSDSTPVEQDNMPTTNPSTTLGENEENEASNTTTVEIATLFGASAPKQDEESTREEPVIEGFINTGLTIMVFNTAVTSANTLNPGVETFPLMGQSVHAGESMFNKFDTIQGGIRFLFDRDRWVEVFTHLPNDASESLHVDFRPYVDSPMTLKEGDPATFIGNQAQNNPNLKMIFFDNLLGNLPEWEKSKTKSALQRDILALHNAGVSNHIALVAIMDTNIPNQNTFLKDLKGVSLCSPVFKVTGTRDENNVPTVSISSEGFSLDLHLDNGKWVEVTVNPTTSENEVLTVLKSRPGGAKKSDIMNSTDLLKSEIDSALKSLKDKGKVVSLRKGTYAAKANA